MRIPRGERVPVPGDRSHVLCSAVTLGVGFLVCWLESCCRIISPTPHSAHKPREGQRVLHVGGRWMAAGTGREDGPAGCSHSEARSWD